VPLSGGEGIIIPEAMRALGGRWLHGLNSMFRPGIPTAPYGFAGGGVNPPFAGNPSDPNPMIALLTQIRDLLAGRIPGPVSSTSSATQRIATNVSGSGVPGAAPGEVPTGGIGPFGTPLMRKSGNEGYNISASVLKAFGLNPDAILGVDPSQYFGAGMGTGGMPVSAQINAGLMAGMGSSKIAIARGIQDALLGSGYSPQTAQAAVATGLLESGLSPTALNSSGHHGIFQESADKPSAGAGQQISWFLGALNAAGGPAVVNANPANVIARSVEHGGYSGAALGPFMGQASALLGGTGAPGVVRWGSRPAARRRRGSPTPAAAVRARSFLSTWSTSPAPVEDRCRAGLSPQAPVRRRARRSRPPMRWPSSSGPR